MSLDLVAILDSVLRANELLERCEVTDLAVPAHDLRVALFGLEASPEHLVAAADMRCDRAAQPDLDLLEVFVGGLAAEDACFRVLVPAPVAREHRGRVVVVALRRTFLAAGAEAGLLRAFLGDRHARHRSIRLAALRDHIGPVDAVLLAVEPFPVFGDRVLVALEAGAVRPLHLSRRSSTISPAFWSQSSPPRRLSTTSTAMPSRSHTPTTTGVRLYGAAGSGLKEAYTE